MRENREIMETMGRMSRMGEPAALATVVRVSGSAYRKEGAKMLINAPGETTGLISGGCLEPDVAEIAKKVMAEKKPVLKRYHMDEDLVWGLGLGCPGTVDIYIEPVPENDALWEEWRAGIQRERFGVFIARLPKEGEEAGGEGRILVEESGSFRGSFGDEELDRRAVQLAREKLGQRFPKSETRTVPLPGGESADLFMDVHVPPAELMIFGAGHDAIPVAELGVRSGFKTVVVDPRPAYATPERFPGADIILADPGNLEERVRIGPRTFVVVMNHHLERDRACIRFAMHSESPYVGVLGPRSRRDRMLKALEEQGITIREEQLKRMYNPVGLDIGAENTEEVAISILSEILAVKNGHAGGYLRDRVRIHQPVRK